MAEVVSICEVCEGRRYTDDVLEYRLRGRNIVEALALPVEEAREFFTEKPVRVMLDRMADVGLGYVALGQELDTLSGGERQRLKLAIEMSGSTEVYVLDEPTTGLHMQDVDNLIGLLDRLVESGRTVIVIEHNLDVVARADWVIDLGPGGGHDGGRVIFEGTPADLVARRRLADRAIPPTAAGRGGRDRLIRDRGSAAPGLGPRSVRGRDLVLRELQVDPAGLDLVDRGPRHGDLAAAETGLLDAERRGIGGDDGPELGPVTRPDHPAGLDGLGIGERHGCTSVRASIAGTIDRPAMTGQRPSSVA